VSLHLIFYGSGLSFGLAFIDNLTFNEQNLFIPALVDYMYSTSINFQMSFAGVDFLGEKESTKPRYQILQLFNSVKHAFKHFWLMCSTVIFVILICRVHPVGYQY
jgi:hypothetical protein